MRASFPARERAYVRWTDLAGGGPVRVFVHGLGRTAAPEAAALARSFPQHRPAPPAVSVSGHRRA